MMWAIALQALWFGVGWWVEYGPGRKPKRPKLYVVRS